MFLCREKVRLDEGMGRYTYDLMIFDEMMDCTVEVYKHKRYIYITVCTVIVYHRY